MPCVRCSSSGAAPSGWRAVRSLQLGQSGTTNKRPKGRKLRQRVRIRTSPGAQGSQDSTLQPRARSAVRACRLVRSSFPARVLDTTTLPQHIPIFGATTRASEVPIKSLTSRTTPSAVGPCGKCSTLKYQDEDRSPPTPPSRLPTLPTHIRAPAPPPLASSPCRSPTTTSHHHNNTRPCT